MQLSTRTWRRSRVILCAMGLALAGCSAPGEDGDPGLDEATSETGADEQALVSNSDCDVGGKAPYVHDGYIQNLGTIECGHAHAGYEISECLAKWDGSTWARIACSNPMTSGYGTHAAWWWGWRGDDGKPCHYGPGLYRNSVRGKVFSANGTVIADEIHRIVGTPCG